MHAQTHLPFPPTEVPQPKELPFEVLTHCRNYREAIRVGVRFSPYIQTEQQLAEALGMDSGRISQILNKKSRRVRYFDPDRFEELESILGNRCVSQFFELQSKRLLHHQRQPKLTIEEKALMFDRMMQMGVAAA